MMPLYHLHIRNGRKLELEPDGTELPDLDATFAEALKVAREFVDEVADMGRDTVIDIADGAGETVLTVPFSEAVRPAFGGRREPANVDRQLPITCEVSLTYPAHWVASLP
jgi:hypothetical protein